jgi:hypothetical protein
MKEDSEVRYLKETIEQIKHIVRSSSDLNCASQVLRRGRPDIVVANEQLDREYPTAGLLLAELRRTAQELGRTTSEKPITVPTKYPLHHSPTRPTIVPPYW